MDLSHGNNVYSFLAPLPLTTLSDPVNEAWTASEESCHYMTPSNHSMCQSLSVVFTIFQSKFTDYLFRRTTGWLSYSTMICTTDIPARASLIEYWQDKVLTSSIVLSWLKIHHIPLLEKCLITLTKIIFLLPRPGPLAGSSQQQSTALVQMTSSWYYSSTVH